MDSSVRYRFDNAWFAPGEARLRLGDEDVILEQKVADLLHAFCRRPGQVLTKTWLMEEIWPGRVVNEDSLSVAVSKLRRVLGDRAAAPKFIRTVTGTGYIWLPEIERMAVPAAETSTVQPQATRWPFAGAAAAVLALAAAAWWLTRDGATAPTPAVVQAPVGEVGQLLERAGERLESDQPEALRQAIAEYREVLTRRPGSAEAYLGIAEAKLELSGLDGHLDIELYAEEAHALLDRALDLDPDNARAWLRKAELHFLADWDFEAAERAYRRAIALEPEDPTFYLPYTELLLTLGEFERSEAVLERLREADPAWYRFVNMTFVYYMRGELERALAETRRLLNSEPESVSYRKMLHRIALLLGDDELAFEQLVLLMRAEGIGEERIAGYAERYRQQGMAALFGTLLDDRLEPNIGHYRPPMSWARYAVTAGRHDAAFHWLGEALQERQPQILLVRVDPHYLPLRDDPRFRALLDRLPRRAGDAASGR